VTVEVVAKDHKGQPVKGLTVEDFQVFEQEAGMEKRKTSTKNRFGSACQYFGTARGPNPAIH